MRTTIDLPDAVFKQVKLKAVQEGIAMKDVVTRAIQRELAYGGSDSVIRQNRATKLFAALDQSRNTEAVGRLKRDDIYDRKVLC